MHSAHITARFPASIEALRSALGRTSVAWPGPWGGGYGWPWPGLLWLAALLLFWGGLIALLIWAIRSSSVSRRAPDSALEILRRRLASGEITPEEYQRLRDLLQQ